MNIQNLAKELGISIGTVSRALNDRPDVNAETRRRVLEAAARLGYEPNQSGRSLRRGTTSTIGFMIQTGHDVAEEGDSFFMSVFDGVQTVLDRHGLDLIILPCSTKQEPDVYLRRMVARGSVDGLILSATRRQDSRLELLEERNIPFITLGRSETGGRHPWIDLDFEQVAHESVRRLVAFGHRRIAVAIPESDLNLGTVFVEAYRDALGDHDVAFDPELVLRTVISEQGGYTIGQHLLALQPRPTAIVLINEVLALGLYRALADAGLTPGHDLAIIGFKESPQTRFLSPSLTCFRLALPELGAALARNLLATIPAYARNVTPDGNMLWPLELVAGESDSKAPATADGRWR